MEEALISYLLQDSGVQGALASRLTWGTAPQATAFPRAVLTLIDKVPEYSDSGEAGVFASRVQVDCDAKTYREAKAAIRAIKTRVSGARVTVGDLEFQGIFVEDEQDSFEADPNGSEKIFRTRIDLMVWHTE